MASVTRSTGRLWSTGPLGLTPKLIHRPSFKTRRLAANPAWPWPHARLAGDRAARAASATFSRAVGQLAGVTVDSRFLVGRDRSAEDEVQLAAQGGPAMGMRRADGESLALQADFRS